jgi:ComF family protein
MKKFQLNNLFSYCLKGEIPEGFRLLICYTFSMKKLFSCITHILFPITCVCCGEIGNDLCITCINTLSEPEHNLPDWIFAAYSYKHPNIRKIVLHLKECPNHRLTDILVKRIFSDPQPLVPSPLSIERDDNADNLLIMPVPITTQRYHERGFNQAEIIARSLLQYIPHSTLCTDIVTKESGHAKQANLTDKTDRIKNAEHIFHITKPAHVAGRDIIIIDDIVTSSATLSSLRDELLHAGAKSVRAVTVGH